MTNISLYRNHTQLENHYFSGCWQKDRFVNFNLAMGIINIVIILFGLPSNLFICYVIIRKKLWKTSNNFLFVLWLSMSDSLNCFILIPLEAISGLTYGQDGFFLTPVMTVFMNSFWYYCSMWTVSILFVMTIYRWLAVAYPFYYLRITKRTINISLMLAWIFNLAYFSFGFAMQDYPTAGFYDFLIPIWAEALLLFLMVLPVFANIIIYGYIFTVVRRKRKERSKKVGSETPNERSIIHLIAENRIYISLMMFFLIAWLPFSIYQIFLHFNIEFYQTCIGESLDTFLSTIIHCNIVENALVYSFSNPIFKSHFKKIKCRKSRIHQMSKTNSNKNLSNRGQSASVDIPLT